jgi:hypothetical protein
MINQLYNFNYLGYESLVRKIKMYKTKFDVPVEVLSGHRVVSY